MRIILLAFLGFISVDLYSQCAEAGRDTMICGYRIGLSGQPDNGTWSYLCEDSTRWVELGGTTAGGAAIALVPECGSYQFIYSVDDMGCTDSDTVTVHFEDDADQSRRIQYDIDIQYGNHDCPGFPYDSCGNIRTFPGAMPPNPRWFINLTGICDANYINTIITFRDSSTCTATINFVGVNAEDTLGTLWTSTQDPFFEVDKLSGQILNNRFGQFLGIIERGLQNGLDSACHESQKCFVFDPPCVDTVFDTIPIIAPVHLGGRWGLIDSSGVTLLNDTTDVTYLGEELRLIISSGARNFGPGDLSFELYRRDQNNNIRGLDTTYELTFFWQEEWTYDTTERVIPRLVPNGQCITCGSNAVTYDTIVFPDFPTTFCPTVALMFNPPIDFEISGNPVICEDGFTIISATPGFAEYRWSNGTTSPFNFITDTGRLSVIATDSSGCTVSDFIDITQANNADYSLLFDSTKFCENNCAEFMVSGSGIRSYFWDNGVEDTTAVYCFSLDDEIITVELTDTNGCRFNDTINLDIQPTNIISAGPNLQITCNRPSVTLMPDSLGLVNVGFFRWEGPGINPSNQNDIQPIVDLPGTYILTNGADSSSCLGRDTVEVRLFDERPDVMVENDALLINCENEEVTIRGEILGNTNSTSFYWEGPGINAGNMGEMAVTTDIPGTYIFFGCNDITGCCSQDTVAVGFNKNQPISDAGPDKTITCDSTSVVIGGAGSSTGLDFIYEWTGPGIDMTNRNQRFPTVRVAGDYTLRVIDTVSRCVSSDPVEVFNRGDVPVASGGPDLLLTCTNSEVVLDGSGSSTGSGIGFAWDGPGITAQNRFDLMPTVSLGGVYIITVLDTAGNCQSTDTVNVLDEIRLPEISAGGSLTIDCNVNAVRLQGQINNDNGRMNVTWAGPGIDDANRNILMARVNRGGTYILTVTDTLNDCVSMDTVEITESFDPPMVDLGNDVNINCLRDSVTLMASLTGYDSVFNLFFWEGPDIDFPTRDQLVQRVGTPGTYTVQVVAANENCNAFDTVEVSLDTMKPDINAGEIGIIGCMSDTIELLATSGSVLNDITWTTQNGTIVGSNEDLSVLVSDIGTYQVMVTGENGCTAVDSVDVEFWRGIDLFVAPNSLVNTCEGDSSGSATIVFTFENHIQLPVEYSLDGGPYSTENNFDNLAAGEYTVTARDGSGCIETITFEIEQISSFQNLPTDTIVIDLCEFDPPITVIGDDFGNDPGSAYWADDTTESVRRSVDQAGFYILVFENDCFKNSVIYSVESNVIPMSQDSILNMPDAFTPNGDNTNDEFIPDFLIDPNRFDVVQYRFTVYNRWGNIVFETTDVNDGWDGTTDGEEAPSEVYLYRIFIGEVIDCLGDRIPLDPVLGDVTLIR